MNYTLLRTLPKSQNDELIIMAEKANVPPKELDLLA